jgi:lysophospholipase L1-like esterase
MSGRMLFGAALLCALGAHAQTQTRVTIVALGASNTEGWGVVASEAYPRKLQALLNARGIDATVINAGIAGDTTGGMLARLERAVPAGTHVVILQPGTNDERMGIGRSRRLSVCQFMAYSRPFAKAKLRKTLKQGTYPPSIWLSPIFDRAATRVWKTWVPVNLLDAARVRGTRYA